MAQQTALSVLGVPGQTQSFVAKEEATVAVGGYLTAKHQLDRMIAPEEDGPTVSTNIDVTEYFLLIDDTHYLLIDGAGHKLLLSEWILGALTPLLIARHQSDRMVAPESEVDN